MKKIHHRLLAKSETYTKWHAHPHHQKIHWGIVILVAFIVLLLAQNAIHKWQNTIYNFVTVQFSPRTAVLTLDPQAKTVEIGDTFTANIILDTAGNPVDGVDVYSLHYDPTILSVVDDNSDRPGTQVTPGAIMDINAVNSVDQAKGTIKYSQIAMAGNSFNGKAVVAAIHFKAIAQGNTYLKFDFKLGNTKDTNVAREGRDKLMNVVDAVYTVTGN